MSAMDKRELVTARLRALISPHITTQPLEIVIGEVVRFMFKEPTAIGVTILPHRYLSSEKALREAMGDMTELLCHLYEGRGLQYISVGDTTTDLLNLMMRVGMTVIVQGEDEFDLT
jgi:hypothetical protein